MTELKREFYGILKEWKVRKGRECLLVKGARQIGKTFIIRKFGRDNYASLVEINFVSSPECISVFEGGLDATGIYAGLSAIFPDARFVPGDTLLFLDEIQECPNARTAMKFLAEDGRCDVIASGSLLGIKYKRRPERQPKSIPVGYERQMTMHSLSLREFLWAKGYGDGQIDMLRGFFERREKVPEPINGKFLALTREYIVVGGMPEVVSGYVDFPHYGEVQRTQEKLLASSIDDIHKYADSQDVQKIEQCYRAIPRLLVKENRKFKYTEIDRLGSARKYLSCVEWLNDAKLASMAECVEAPLAGLAAYVKEGTFKLYLSDIGMLCSLYGMLVKRQILDGSLAGSMKGGVYENLVSGILERNGVPLRYLNKDGGRLEMEFLVEAAEGVVPVEVKAQVGATRSLDKLLEDGSIPYGYKLSGGNVGVVGKKITLPHYMAMFINQPADGDRPPLPLPFRHVHARLAQEQRLTAIEKTL